MRLVLSAQRVSTLPLCQLACGLLIAACAGSGASPAGGSRASNGNPDTGQAGAADDPVPTSLAFMTTETVMLSPKQTQQLTVTATPAGVYVVRFALVGTSSTSGPSDAVISGDALNGSAVTTVEDGIAQVTLTAPSTPTTFSVRASVAGGVPTFLPVSVSALDYTTLHVQPAYSGHRSVKQWTASIHVGGKCSKLGKNPPPDGTNAVTANGDQPLTIQKVPIGVDVAVTLREGHYI